MVEDQVYMERALELAQMAAAIWEVPVGAVVVCDGQIVGEGYNRRESGKNALAHAELEAIDMACRRLGGWRLHRCDLYVTLEPCPMCAGAIVNARIRRVVYGASDPKAGCFGSVSDFNALPFNHKPEIVSGVLQNECAGLLSAFFQRTAEPSQKSRSIALMLCAARPVIYRRGPPAYSATKGSAVVAGNPACAVTP